MSQNRKAIFQNIIREIDLTCELVTEYDSKPHQYGEVILYQAESYMVDAIGENPGITITDLAKKEKKTKSACSQLLRKLMTKGCVIQKRNAENHREYMLFLTEMGEKVFEAHIEVNEFCDNRAISMLEKFTEEELDICLKIQRCINNAFKEDVKMNCHLHAVNK